MLYPEDGSSRLLRNWYVSTKAHSTSQKTNLKSYKVALVSNDDNVLSIYIVEISLLKITKCLLGCDTLWCCRCLPMFWRNGVPLSFGWKSELMVMKMETAHSSEKHLPGYMPSHPTNTEIFSHFSESLKYHITLLARKLNGGETWTT
jgi:hypothetical protein